MPPDVLASLRVTPDHPTRWIVVGKLLDTTNRRVLTHAHLIYNSTQILHVGNEQPTAALTAGRQGPDLMLEDYTALPGLIEGHSHTFLEGAELAAGKRGDYQKQDPDTLYQMAASRLHILARLGIIAMRDGGDKDRVGLRLSRDTAPERCPPFTARVLSPGGGIYRHGRYGGFFGTPVEDHASIESCVQARVAEGADHIKIVPTGIIHFAKGAVTAKPQFEVAEIRQFRQAAHAHQRHLMAHASGEIGVGHAIDGGVDTLEHGFFISDSQLAQMRDKDIAWVPTFSPVQEQVDHAAIMGWDAPTLDHLRRILDNHARSLQIALALGVTVLVGSDSGSCGVAHGTGLLYEMELLEMAGMPTLDILCQVTRGNSRRLLGGARCGSLEAGYEPRFILTAADPLATVRHLQHERLVVFDGAADTSANVCLANL